MLVSSFAADCPSLPRRLKLIVSVPEISQAEQKVCEGIASLLHLRGVGDALEMHTVPILGSALQFFLADVLSEVHDEWRYESLDGIYPRVFRKTGERAVEFLGLGVFISDQTLTPIHFQMQLSPTLDSVAWIDLRLGEHSESGCRREPYTSATVNGPMLHVAERLSSIEWFYHVGYGGREG